MGSKRPENSPVESLQRRTGGSPEEADAKAGQQGTLVPQDGRLNLISRSSLRAFCRLERKWIVVFALLSYHMEGL